jgi:hypothetical protein
MLTVSFLEWSHLGSSTPAIVLQACRSKSAGIQFKHDVCLNLQGASAELWKGYLPNAEIWFAEYDVACVERHSNKLKEIGVRVVTGDQADNATLARWLQETGGGFDVIVVSTCSSTTERC